MIRFFLTFFLLINYLSTCGCDVDVISKDIVLKNVDRSVDLSSQLVKIVSKITLENVGKSPVKYFLHTIDSSHEKELAFLGASLPSAVTDDGRLLDVSQASINGKTSSFWRIGLRHSLEPGKSVQVEVEAIFTRLLRPYPAQITQAEVQHVRYEGNLYLLSPYSCTKQTTTVTMGSGTIESYTKVKPFVQNDKTITYGPYENIGPNSNAELAVHVENNSPFITVTNHERTIEISHWGNIAVEESVSLLHSGAVLKGPFSRYEYQRDQNGLSSVKSFKTVLPAAAMDVYYRDEIGNISTSHLRVLDDAVEVDLRPRFPLFGGWKTHYVIGYNLPSYEYLYNTGDQYVLKMRFIDHIFDDMFIEHASVKIILPEGVQNTDIKCPYAVRRSPNSLHFTYLDTTGRTVITVHKDNLVENHIQDFELHYTYQKLLMLQEPLLVVLAFYLLFVLVIIYVRLDFSIIKDIASESKMKVSSLCEQVQFHHDKRFGFYLSYENAIQNFKSSKDTNAFQTTQKKLANDNKNETKAIAALIVKMKLESAESAEKVTELQKLDQQMCDQIKQQITYAERLVGGKMKKDQYVDFENSILKKKEEIHEKMENIITAL